MEAGTIVLIINLVFFFILLIGFLTGLRRGFRRSALHLVFVAFSILIAYFITRPIVDLVLGLTVIPYEGEVVSIGKYITSLMGDVAKYSPTMGNFIAQFPAALVGPIVFMLVLLAVQFLMWIIFMIVARICFKTRKYEKANGIKRHRLFGAFIGTVEAIIFAIFLFMPLTSLTNTFGELAYVKNATDTQTSANTTTSSQLKTTGELIRENMPEFALQILDGYNSSAMGAICHLGGFDHVVFNGLSYIDINGEKIMWRDEVTLLANIYNRAVEIVNTDKDLTSEDYKKLTELANQFVEGKLLTHVISPAVTEVVENFDKVLEDANFDDTTRENVQTVVDNLNKRFDAGVTFIKYVEDNVNVLGEVVNNLSDNGALETIANSEKLVDALTYDTLSKIVPQVDKVIGMTLVEDIYSVVDDSLVENFKDNEYIDGETFRDFNAFKADIKKLFEVVRDASNIKATEEASTNMLQDIVNGQELDSKVFINSDMANPILQNMTQINSFKKGIVKIMETVDTEIIEAAKSMYEGNATIDDSQFAKTISSENTDEEISNFVERLGLQTNSFVEIARLAINGDFSNDSDLSDVGVVLDVMKENITQNNFDETTLTSDGVFSAMFKNLYQMLNGTIKDANGNVVFEDYDKFNNLIEKRADGETTDLKYYKVNYKELCAELQSAKDVADAYDKRKNLIETTLNSDILTHESVEVLKTAFEGIVNEVGTDDFMGAVNVAMDVIGDEGYDITNGNVDAKNTVTEAIDTLELGEEVSAETLQNIKDSLKKLFKIV